MTIPFQSGLFPAVLGPGLGGGLPLHVAGQIGAAALEGDDVVYHVAGAGASGFERGRAGLTALEFCFCAGAALDAAVLVAVAGLAARR